jgi:hypothetical protein
MSRTILNNQVHRSISPAPLRSPTPDCTNKSGIIRTKPLKTPHNIMNH